MFIVKFRPGPGCSDPIRSLRALLKAAKRRFGLVAVDAVEEPDQNKQQASEPVNPINQGKADT
jgi:hypothetical protein